MPIRGLWIDDPISAVTAAPFWDEVKAHRIETAAIMLESFSGGFDPKYKVKDLEKVKTLALERDIEIVLTVCPEPSRNYLEELEAHIGELLLASGAAGLEFDVEGNWLPIKVQGFGDLEDAGNELACAFHSISLQYDVRTEITTYPYHTENSKTAELAPHASRILPQAYSVRHRDGKEISWVDRLGPGNMQRLTMDRALMVPGVGGPGGPLVSCGLAAYDQVFPGRPGDESMHTAYKAALMFSPFEVRWWSSKWVLGCQANGYASRFLKSLK